MPLSVVHDMVIRVSSGITKLKNANHYANFADHGNLFVIQCILLVRTE